MAKYRWIEDDATLNDPDAEKVNQAWERLFNEDNFNEQWRSVEASEENDFDCFTRTMPNGVKVTLSCEGWCIE